MKIEVMLRMDLNFVVHVEDLKNDGMREENSGEKVKMDLSSLSIM